MKKKILVAVAAVLVFAFISIGALAATNAVQATLTFRDIKITLNGELLEPKDATGKVVEPFIIDGTTYLPVRAISEALGLDVEWDNDTSTVQLSEKQTETDTPDTEALPMSETPAPGTVLAPADAAPPVALEPTPVETPQNESQERELPTLPVEATPDATPPDVPTQPSGATEPAHHGGTGNGDNFNTYDNEDQQITTEAYVLNTRSMKIHHPSCSQVPKIAPQNYATSDESLEVLLGRGYTTCGVCFK